MSRNTDADSDYERALTFNRHVGRHGIPVMHAMLWVSALCLAVYFHVSASFTRSEALLFSTLSAYGAYLCESVLATVNVMASKSMYSLDFRRAGLWGWIGTNLCINVGLSFLYLHCPHWTVLGLIILTAGWQKYMDGRIPVRLESTAQPL